MIRDTATPGTGSPGALGKKTQATIRQERSCRKGTLLCIEGEPGNEMFLVKSGRIRLLKHEGDTTVVVAVAGPGSVIGEMSLLHHDPWAYTAQVVEDSVVIPIDEETYHAALKNIPSWFGGALQSLVKRLSDSLRQTSEEMVRKNVAGVVRVLLLLAENEADRQADSFVVPLRRFKETLYNVIGLSDTEMERIFLHLILKRMVRICRDENGMECMMVIKREVVRLYYDYLRSRQRNEPFLADGVPLSAFDLAGFLLTGLEVTGEGGRSKHIKITRTALEAAWQRKGKKLPIDPEALKALMAPGSGGDDMLVFDPVKVRLLHLAGTWLPVFKEDVKL